MSGNWNGLPVSSGPASKFRLMHILHSAKLFLLICGAVFSMVLIAWFMLSDPDVGKNANPQSENSTIISKPIVQERRERFKRNVRQIGGESFSPPKVKIDEITRLPSSQRSLTERKNHAREKASSFQLTSPVVLDINTIKSGKITVTIANIEPVPVGKTCKSDHKTVPCGRMARTALRALIRGRTLNCRVAEEMSQNGETVTSCSVGKTDIGQWLVDQGWTQPTFTEKP